MTGHESDAADLTLADAAARLGLSRDALRKRCDRGLVAGAYKLDGRWMIPPVNLTGLTDRPPAREVRTADRSATPDMTGQALQTAVEALTAQLAVKDRQIEALLAQVERLQARLPELGPQAPTVVPTPPASGEPDPPPRKPEAGEPPDTRQSLPRSPPAAPTPRRAWWKVWARRG